MSIPDPPREHKASRDILSRNRMSARDAEELQKLDAAVDRLFKVIPDHPYILSVPCSEPRYHYPTQQEAESWAKNTPFSLDEERLQYMTYIYREPSDSCFVMRSQVDEERDKLAQAKKFNGIPSGGATPLQSAGVKKKISLSAYKSKLAAGATSQKPPGQEKKDKIMDPVDKMQRTGEDGGKVSKAAATTQTSAASGQKRARNNSDPTMSTSTDRKDRIRPAKKPRTSLSPASGPLENSQSNGAPHNLPPLLSPTFPSNPWGLPQMLSPTLPANIEAALVEEEKKQRARTDSNASSSSTDKKVKPQVTSVPTVSAKLHTADHGDGTPGKNTKIVAQSFSKSTSTLPTMTKPNGKSEIETPPITIGAKVYDDSKVRKLEATEPKPSKLIVRLKYGRKNRKQVERILRLPPRPIRDQIKPRQITEATAIDQPRARASSSASQQVDRTSRESAVKDAIRKPVLHLERANVTTTPEKRSRPDDSDSAPSAKRKKLPESLDLNKNPSTPNQPPITSPSIQKSGGSTKSAHHFTPRNDHLKSVAMGRSISNETTVSTPGSKRSHLTPLPGTTTKSGDRGPTSAPANGAKAVQLNALNSLSMQYNKLGRKLKHENQAVFAKPKDELTDDDRKRAALLGLECVFAYMLAYALGDVRRRAEGRAGEIESTWLTLLQLFRHLGGFTRRFRHLEGLHNHLGVAIYSRISAVIADRLGRSSSTAPVSADSPQSTQPENNIHNPFAAPKPEVMAENWKALAECSRDAGTKLSVEDLINHFPATWASRAVGTREHSWESFVNKDGDATFQGKYYIPVAVDTTPIQAVRFGVELVKEWVQKEGLAYEAQVKL